MRPRDIFIYTLIIILFSSCNSHLDTVLDNSGLNISKSNNSSSQSSEEKEKKYFSTPGHGGSEDSGSEDSGSEDGGSEDSGSENGGSPVTILLQPTAQRDPNKLSATSCQGIKTYLGLNDPFSCNAWHVLSVNQNISKLPNSSVFSEKPTQVSDFNLWDTYSRYTGNNIKIHISDNGTQHDHPDLLSNYTQIGSRHYQLITSSEGYGHGVDGNPNSGNHGTPVAGLISAVGNNGKGLFGVAYESTFSADDFIQAAYTDSWREVLKRLSSDDIVNWSWGIPYFKVVKISGRNYHQISGSFLPDSNFYRSNLLYGANSNHISYFKSSGNEGRIPGADANVEHIGSLYPINTIAALNTSNSVIDYSTPGANITFAGYAHRGGSKLGTCTTQQSSSYTCGFNGTSSASPTVAGAAALVMQALKENPNMSVVRWSDLAWVLISTANKDIGNRENHSLHYQNSVGGENLVPKVTNGFGLTHSFDFGFGVPNVKMAIQKAENMSGSLGPVIDGGQFSSQEGPRSFNRGECAIQSIQIDKDFQIWSLELGLSTKNVYVRDLAVFLTMPDGNKAMIKNTVHPSVLSNGTSTFSYSQLFKVNAAMGLNARGIWKVKVCHNNRMNQSGEFHGAKIRLFGFDDLDILK